MLIEIRILAIVLIPSVTLALHHRSKVFDFTDDEVGVITEQVVMRVDKHAY